MNSYLFCQLHSEEELNYDVWGPPCVVQEGTILGVNGDLH